jgi:hypothetical protein
MARTPISSGVISIVRAIQFILVLVITTIVLPEFVFIPIGIVIVEFISIIRLRVVIHRFLL